ncbi:MAG TPA: hypothetical protein EYQ27_17825 [Gemmatimonadetes bacterium]|nr:hypothetical protein [Gemmatimonadota bacterium]
MKATWPALALTALMIVGSACLDDSITGTRTLTFSLSADPTSTTVGQTVTFNYEGTGTRIQGVVVDYGDGSVDSVFTPGTVVEVEGSFVHEYGTSGTFQAVGRLETVEAFLSDTVTIQVNAP